MNQDNRPSAPPIVVPGIGARTETAASCVVHAGASIGADSKLGHHVVVHDNASIGDRVEIGFGVQVPRGLRIEDDVVISANVAFESELGPGSALAPATRTIVRKGASIGANATLHSGITVGQHAVVGAGAVVTQSVPPYAVVVGNPAHIVRYAAEGGSGAHVATPIVSTAGTTTPEIVVRGVEIIGAPIIHDMRGNLIAREVNKGLPFTPQRTFFIFDVPSKEVRGAHAHRVCKQFLVCLHGSVSVVCDDGDRRQEIELSTPDKGLYLPPMVWGIQYKYAPGSQLLVYASHGYDAADYIRDYDVFMAELRK